MSPLLVAWLLGPANPVAPATPTAAAEMETTRVVVLMPTPGDDRVTDIVATARASLPPGEVELLEVTADSTRSPVRTARTAAKQQHAKGVFWFDLRDDREFLVYVYLPERDVTLRRRVPEAAQSVQAAIEAMWIIVRSGAVSLARGVEIGMEAVDPKTLAERSPAQPKPAPTKPTESTTGGQPQTEPKRPLGLALSVSYLGHGFARRIAWQSGGTVSLAYRVQRLIHLGIGYGIVGGMRVADPTTLSVVRHDLTLSLGVGGFVTKRIGLRGRVLPTLELVRWRADDSGARAVQPASKLGAEAMLQIRVAPRITVDLAAGADIGLTSYAFVLCGDPAPSCSGDARALVVAPWRVRPRARAGITALF
ncbi:MAG: hypothetical protein AAF721_07975 [Myxococcota bacterium]